MALGLGRPSLTQRQTIEFLCILSRQVPLNNKVNPRSQYTTLTYDLCVCEYVCGSVGFPHGGG